MNTIASFDALDFPSEEIARLKGAHRIVLVISTFGSRDTLLLLEKIRTIKDSPGLPVDQILVSHRRPGLEQDPLEQLVSEMFPDVTLLVCNHLELPDMGDEPGKGADMRRALYHINTSTPAKADRGSTLVCFLDADSVSEHFGVHYLLGLVGPLLKGYDLSRASFVRSRGRATRFAAQPFFSLIVHPDLAGLSSLAYPLSGESAASLAVLNDLYFMQGYGFETALNIQAVARGLKIADVNLGSYDHFRQDDRAIQQMSFSVMRTALFWFERMGIIEFRKGASLSDTFRFQEIDPSLQRKEEEFLLDEKMYQPLSSLVEE